MIRPVNAKDIPALGKNRKYTKRICDIEEFIKSGEDACEILLQKGENIKHVFVSYHNAINRRQYYKDLVRVCQRNKRLFMVRVEGKRV